MFEALNDKLVESEDFLKQSPTNNNLSTITNKNTQKQHFSQNKGGSQTFQFKLEPITVTTSIERSKTYLPILRQTYLYCKGVLHRQTINGTAHSNESASHNQEQPRIAIYMVV